MHSALCSLGVVNHFMSQSVKSHIFTKGTNLVASQCFEESYSHEQRNPSNGNDCEHHSCKRGHVEAKTCRLLHAIVRSETIYIQFWSIIFSVTGEQRLVGISLSTLLSEMESNP